jgi:hypothetical protein
MATFLHHGCGGLDAGLQQRRSQQMKLQPSKTNLVAQRSLLALMINSPSR